MTTEKETLSQNSGLTLPLSTTSQENTPQAFPQVSLIERIQLKFHLPRFVQVCVKLTKPTSTGTFSTRDGGIGQGVTAMVI